MGKYTDYVKVFTDGSSSDATLLSDKTKSKVPLIVQKLKTQLYDLSKTGCDIRFIWVPGHPGIDGNEIADQAAKLATAEGTQLQILFSKDLIKSHSKVVFKQWELEWSKSNSKLFEMKPEICLWQTSSHPNLKFQNVLCRLRIGHTNATHVMIV